MAYVDPAFVCGIPNQTKIFIYVGSSCALPILTKIRALLQKCSGETKPAGQEPHIPVSIGRIVLRRRRRDGSRRARSVVGEPVEELKRKPFVEVWVADISGSSIVASKCCGDQQCLKVRID